jgi:hypothetical protein
VEDGQTLPSSLTTDNEALGKGKRKKNKKRKNETSSEEISSDDNSFEYPPIPNQLLTGIVGF